MTHLPLWFGPPARPLFGQLHLPEGEKPRAGVVLCAPLGFEETCSHRTFRVLAERLAGAGFAALRFDYDGTGDSAGRGSESGRLDAWRASTRHAVDLLRGQGFNHVTIIGMRAGGLLAADVAREMGLSNVVLWDPLVSGRSYLRELALLGETGLGPERANLANGVDAPGLELPADTVTQMQSWQLSIAGLSAPVLALIRRDRPTGRVQQALRDGEDVTVVEAVGQARLLEGESIEATVPSAAITTIVSWIDEHSPQDLPRVSISVGAREEVTIDRVHSVRERVVRIGPLGLFGVITDSAMRPPAFTLVCLNNSIDAHVGPARLWVELARALAPDGWRVIRFDLRGIGDSPSPTGEEDRPYPSEAVEDIAAALKLAEGQVTLIGLCSGAVLSISAAEALGIRRVIAFNPSLHIPLDVLWKIHPDDVIPAALRRVNRDHRLRRRAAVALPEGIRRVLSPLALRRGIYPQLRSLIAQGAAVTLIYGEDEFALWKVRQTVPWALRRFDAAEGFSLVELPFTDHGLLRASSQRLALAEIRRALASLANSAVQSTAGADASSSYAKGSSQ